MNKNEIEEARATLWKEFDTISDERIAFLMHTFKLIARMLIEKIEKGAAGNLISKNTFKYNENGLLVEKIEIDSYGSIYKQNFKYEFDKENNWIKKTIFINEKLSALHERKIEYY